MKDKRHYQKNPQSEEELKTVRAKVFPDIVRAEEPKIISVNSSEIMGIVYCEQELKDRANEEYQCRKSRKEIREAAALRMVSATKGTATAAAPTTAKKLSIPQIALIYAYEYKTIITRENAQEIIEKYGWTSGEKLYQQFNNYRRPQDRIADPDKTKKSLENKIKLFESVIQFLTQPKNKLAAIDEVNTLKSKLNKSYL